MFSNSNETLKPQLLMVHSDLDNLPELDLPEPYKIRSEKPGDDKAWEKIITESFKQKFSYDTMTNDKAYKPERIFFVTDVNDEPVATAASWVTDDYPPDCAVLHMVGVLPEHTGHRLGYYVSLSAMKHAREEGFSRMALRTDDWRIPAVKTYLRLGYMPVVIHENQIERWKKILRQINREDLLDLIRSVYDGTTTKTI